MKYEKFGDSYDFVKRGLVQLLTPCGDWFVHPMFTDPDGVVACYWKDYCRFLGVPTVTCKTLKQSGWSRANWFEAARICKTHLLLDPDTGIPFDKCGRPSHQGRSSAAAFLRASELVEIAKKRPDKLTLVFDQSFHRKKCLSITTQIEQKLNWLECQRIHGLAYHSHANFILVSKDQRVLSTARGHLEKFNFPDSRLILPHK